MLSSCFNGLVTDTQAQSLPHLLQLGSELFINEQIDEEVGQVGKVDGKAKVAAHCSAQVVNVNRRGEGQDEDDEETQTNLH